MSTSLLYHAFGAQTYDYLRTEYRAGAVHFHVHKKPAYRASCMACGSLDVTIEGRQTPSLRALPIGSKPVFLVLHLRVLACKACGAVMQESRDVAASRKTYTRAFARYVVGLSSEMTIQAIAKHLRVSWDLVKSIIKQDLSRRAKRRSWRKVRFIAIDEIAIRKGHSYMTVVMNLETGEVLYTALGKDHSTLKAFFRRLRRSRARLKAIAVDMSKAYLKAIELYAPAGVKVIHDRYHLVANMNKVIDKVRRDEQKRMEDEHGKKLIKGSRYLLLRAREKLEELPEKHARLQALLEINETLHAVYLLKEELRQFWRLPTKKEAKQFIANWVKDAMSLGNRHLTTFAQTIKDCTKRIVAWYDHPISTGPLEGTNNKIKVLKRKAYGYRDQVFFGLRVMFIHETSTKLSGA